MLVSRRKKLLNWSLKIRLSLLSLLGILFLFVFLLFLLLLVLLVLFLLFVFFVPFLLSGKLRPKDLKVPIITKLLKLLTSYDQGPSFQAVLVLKEKVAHLH